MEQTSGITLDNFGTKKSNFIIRNYDNFAKTYNNDELQLCVYILGLPIEDDNDNSRDYTRNMLKIMSVIMLP